MKSLWVSLCVAAVLTACSNSNTNTTAASDANTPAPATTVATSQDTPTNTDEPKAMLVADKTVETPATEDVSNTEDATTANETIATKPSSSNNNVKPTAPKVEEPANVPAATTPEPEPTPAPTPTKEAPVATAPTTTTKPAATPEPAAKPAREMLSHDLFDQLLRKYVSSSGKVNYDGMKQNKKMLKQYLELLKNHPPQSDWSKNKTMAYWINLYNAFTIYSIVEAYPVKSIMDIEGGKIWDKKTISIGGKSLTLNQIEKDKLLKRYKEPRVHFAVNCAAASCPPLLNKAWTEDNVQRYLSKQAKAFINNTKENSVTSTKLNISQIFNWYAGDFGGSDKIVAYFQKYSEVEIKDNAKVSFRDYDWSLNNK